ncbi:hypothetical protein Patl1_32702 [Pistacia atlantica]|uniref:Uncharacterized protein n=1 Tax=Pistacia atlantica TaxID=434234 RepID=A0ACC1APW3_9ROSI|nr:hypothetical protein Patl1_32702 [Pistacia atlantica]
MVFLYKAGHKSVECYKEPRTTRVLQKQQNRLLQQNQNRVVLRGGLGFNGGLVRESGGTGVFHPRIIKATNTTAATATSTDAKKKVVRNRQDIQAMQQRNFHEKGGGKQAGGLPLSSSCRHGIAQGLDLLTLFITVLLNTN